MSKKIYLCLLLLATSTNAKLGDFLKDNAPIFASLAIGGASPFIKHDNFFQNQAKCIAVCLGLSSTLGLVKDGHVSKDYAKANALAYFLGFWIGYLVKNTYRIPKYLLTSTS